MIRPTLLPAALALATALLLPASAPAAAPELLSYQGVLTLADGTTVPDGDYTLTFAIYDDPVAGTPLYAKTLTVGVVDGLYNVILSTPDAGVPLLQVFDSSGQRYMGVTIEAGPAALGYPVDLLPRHQMASVPYALSSANASGTSPAHYYDESTGVGFSASGTIVAGPLTAAIPSDGVDRDIIVHGKCRLYIQNSNAKAGILALQQDDGSGFLEVDLQKDNALSNQTNLHAPLSVLAFVGQAAPGSSHAFQLVASGSHSGTSNDCKLLVEIVPVF